MTHRMAWTSEHPRTIDYARTGCGERVKRFVVGTGVWHRDDQSKVQFSFEPTCPRCRA